MEQPINTADVPARPGWGRLPNSRATPASPVAEASGRADRAVAPALLASFVAHLLLALILSLVVFGTAQNERLRELVLTDSQEFSVEETAAFELRPEAAPEWQAPAAEVSVEIPKFELAPPPPFTLPAAEAAEGSAEGEQAAELAFDESGLAKTIQERVAAAGGQRGEVQFALAWKNVNDVDLHVITPSGARISHLRKRSPTGGTLDVDMNVRGESTEPVENVRWINDAPWGRYTVLIHLFRIHRPKAGDRVTRGSQFQLLAQLGSQSDIKTDTVSAGGPQISVFRFQYIPESLPAPRRAALTRELQALQVREETLASPLLEEAQSKTKPQLRDSLLNNLIRLYPHTDAAIQAMRLLGGDISKT